uniref:Uncharacterized protein n=1 Tax=Marmota marmota marmota TaxID=9994 RepID=A0A8C5Z9I3_MARMA
MVQAPSPIHSDVCLLLIKFHSTCWVATSRQLTELKQAIEYWTNGLTSLHLLAILRHVIWTNGAQEFDVVITVVLGHLLSIGFVRALEETIVEQQIVSHADSVRLHWVALTMLTVVVVTDFPPGALSLRHLAASCPSRQSVRQPSRPRLCRASDQEEGRFSSPPRPSPPGLTYSRAARARLQPIS